MNFGRSKQDCYRKSIVPVYGDFLCKCYSKFYVSPTYTGPNYYSSSAPEECHTHMLPDKEAYERIANMDLENNGFD